MSELYTCPTCSGSGCVPSLVVSAEYVRIIDPKGRLYLPADLTQALGDRFAAELGERYLRLRPSWRGRQGYSPTAQASGLRLLLSAEFRQAVGLHAGVEAALARRGEVVLVWSFPRWGAEMAL